MVDLKEDNFHDIYNFEYLLQDYKKAAELVNISAYADDTLAVEAGIKLKKAQVAHQKKHLPMLRKAFANVCKKKLWEDNIDVYYNNSVITFKGIQFADNAYIAKSNDFFMSVGGQLRYKKVKYDDGYEVTTYDLKPPKDDELFQ